MTQILLAGKALVYGPQFPACVLQNGGERVIDRDLVRHLEDSVRRHVANIAVLVGAAGPQQKVVVLLLAPDGAKIGYAKVGWQNQARRLVQHEAASLSRLRGEHLLRAEIPEILYFGEYRGLSVLVTSPLHFVSLRGTLEKRHVEFLEELCGLTLRLWSFRSSPFRMLLDKRVATLQIHLSEELARSLHAILAFVDSGLDKTRIPFTWSVGDFVPWNLGHDPRTGRLVVVDVESFSDHRPLGWDLFHFLTRGGTRAYEGQALPHASSWGLVARFFSSLGFHPTLVPYLQVAYLLDIWTQRAEAHILASGGLSATVLAAVCRGLRLTTRAGVRARALSAVESALAGSTKGAVISH